MSILSVELVANKVICRDRRKQTSHPTQRHLSNEAPQFGPVLRVAYVFVFSSQYMPIPLQPTSFVVPLIISFLILSSLVSPLIHHLNLLIAATSNFLSCAFFTADVSAPSIIAGLTTVLYRPYFPLDSQTYSSVAVNCC